ncbi:hypothetical protein CP532_4285 [Ophiocordyceps camponoti-leonardi (nom. inval.)]|nr:hypothetical protein CP532_4285 [Ophiocordyceps camponoti-leonardi (nom. inval.)]
MTPTTESRPGSDTAYSPRSVKPRTQSMSSSRPSTVDQALSFAPTPSTVSPQPEFIAASAAVQIVTADHDGHADTWYDQNGVEPAPEAAHVSPPALRLVNVFLDQLLFNFLQLAGSATLSALRPAVSDVLKPKLAKDAIASADDELREYLGNGEEDDDDEPDAASRDWDVELAWKRTRLRCMVYSSLGDMEEDDEDLYLEQDNLEMTSAEQPSAVISPAAAIFLTSIIEYMGELTLTVAGRAAYNRVRVKAEKDLKNTNRHPPYMADRIVVTETDMEHVAFDRSLGRLWRGWKKRLRSSGADPAAWPLPTDLSIPSVPSTARSASRTESSMSHDRRDTEPAHIPLPLSHNDVEEIEVPGLAYNSDDSDNGGDDADADDDGQPADATSHRPKSLTLGASIMANGLPTPSMSQPESPVLPTRKRSNSLPNLPTVSSSTSRKPSSAETQQDAVTHQLDVAKPARREVAIVGTSAILPGALASCSEDKAAPSSPSIAVPSSPTLAAGDQGCRDSLVSNQNQSRRDTVLSNRDDEEDDVFFETAEIVTSSRVSIAGSSASESGRASTIKRSSSVHSARIIDVPRSPAHSRNASLEVVERPRRITPPSVTSAPRSFSAEGDGRPRAVDRSRTLAHASALRDSLERSRSARPSTATASETVEDANHPSSSSSSPPSSRRGPGALEAGSLTQVAVESSETMGLTQSKPAVSSETVNPTPAGFEASTEPSVPRGSRGLATTVTNVTRRDHAPTHIRLTTKIPAGSPQASPDLTQKPHTGWHSPKLPRTRDADEEPSQTSVAPRQIHTSASSASSGTSKRKPVRTSEDNNSSHAESVARNFEELIQSNQTITYTLTPETMRDNVSKRSLEGPVVTKVTRKSDEARGQNSPRSSPVVTEAPRSVLSRPPMSAGSPRTGEVKAQKSPAGPVPRVPPGLAVSTGRATGPQARDARTSPGESTADFAQFIKSTGPAFSDRGPSSPGLAKSPTTSTRPGLDSHPVSSPGGGANRNRQQPREAVVDNKTDSSDLIDFIRQGPPILASNNPRIPRHVAPFRTTMDSDQLTSGGGMAIDATIPEIRYSQGSTNLTDNSMPSMQSSINSNSALLKKAAPVPSMNFDEAMPMPRRKQRRVRDPYAVDLSDEDEADLDDDADDMGTVRAPLKKEESLAEFLRNYEPPPEPPSPQQPARRMMPRKKASAPSLIGRLTRRESKDLASPPPVSKSVARQQESRSLNSRAGGVGGRGGYIPIQVSMPPGYNKYGAVEGGPTTSMPRVTTSASTGRVPMKRFEPREAAVSKSQTGDLAAFLRDSVPPPDAGGGRVASMHAPAAGRTSSTTRQDEGNGLSKMFGRKKKVGAL